MIHEIKKITSIPVAVLTNGTLLFKEDVQKDLIEADVVLPSLDAASQDMFKKVNRPHYSLRIESVMDGLRSFRRFFRGLMWLEIMLIKGFNNNLQELSGIKKAVSEIRPDEVYLNTVSRPPSEIYAEPLNLDEMTSIKNYLDGNCEVIAEFHKKRSTEVKDIEGSIIEMAKRRSLTVTDIVNVFGISKSNVKKLVEKLKEEGKITDRQYREKNTFCLSQKLCNYASYIVDYYF